MQEKLYVLHDDNHEGAEGIHGIFSTLAALEEYQFQHQLKGVFTDISTWLIDQPNFCLSIPQLIRLAPSLEKKCMEENPDYKQEKLQNARWYCEDCKVELVACWDCGYFHCKCQQKQG